MVLRWSGFALAAFVLVFVCVKPPRQSGEHIRSDGVGYHMWSHALLSGDLNFCRYAELMDSVGAISHRGGGRCQNKYGPGLAMLRLPAMAFVVDPNRVDSISEAEHLVSMFSGVVALVLIIMLMTSTLRANGLPWGRVQFATLSICFGTGLFHYATYDNSFSHIYSGLGTALLVYMTDRRQRKGRPIWPAVYFLVPAMMFLVRPTNALIVGPFVALWVFQEPSFRRSKLIALSALSLGLLVTLMLGYNAYVQGTLSATSYSGFERFEFDRLVVAPILFSYDGGLFTYYPILVPVLLLGAWTRETRIGTMVFGLMLALLVLCYGFWFSWRLGAMFGHRGFVEAMPVGMYLLGMSIKNLDERVFVRTMLVLSALVFATIQLMWGYWLGTLPFHPISATDYWKHVLLGYTTPLVADCMLFLLVGGYWFRSRRATRVEPRATG